MFVLDRVAKSDRKITRGVVRLYVKFRCCQRHQDRQSNIFMRHRFKDRRNLACPDKINILLKVATTRQIYHYSFASAGWTIYIAS